MVFDLQKKLVWQVIFFFYFEPWNCICFLVLVLIMIQVIALKVTSCMLLCPLVKMHSVGLHVVVINFKRYSVTGEMID